MLPKGLCYDGALFLLSLGIVNSRHPRMMSYALENHKTVFKIMNLKTIIVTCLRDPFFEIREDESPELFSHKKTQSLHYQDTSVIYSSDFGRCVF